MTWTSNGFFRNVNILSQLSEASGNQIIDIYQPGTLNSRSLVEDVRYSGFITSLRLTAEITSIAEVQFPAREIGMSEGEFNSLVRQVESGSPKKSIHLWMRSSSSPNIKIGSLYLFNRRPYYTVDLLLYFTDAVAFDVASDTVIAAQVENVGYGLLSGVDRVCFHGSVVEEGENTSPNLSINVFGSGTGDAPTAGNLVLDNQGNTIVDNQSNLVVY